MSSDRHLLVVSVKPLLHISSCRPDSKCVLLQSGGCEGREKSGKRHKFNPTWTCTNKQRLLSLCYVTDWSESCKQGFIGGLSCAKLLKINLKITKTKSLVTWKCFVWLWCNQESGVWMSFLVQKQVHLLTAKNDRALIAVKELFKLRTFWIIT